MKRLCVFVALSLSFLSASSWAVQFRVSDIRLEGLQRVSASPVFAALPVRVGEDVDSEDVRDIIGALFDTGFFSNVQVAREDDVLIIVLQERPSIKKIELEGNKAIKTEQLTDVLDDNDLREGEILQSDVLQNITRELERQYVARARYGASVEAKIEELPNNMVNIQILVDEGDSAKIKHLNIVGNEIFSEKELLQQFELTSTRWNSFFTSSDKYAREKLTGDIEKLESFYLDRGYLDFEVQSTQVSISPNKEQVFITINISEGEVYKIKSVDIAGDPVVPESQIKRLVLLREGSTFSQQLMTDSTEYITTMMGNAGYTNAKVEGIPKKNPEDKTVDLTIFVDPGMRVYVRRIEFRGNTKTNDDVLRREMRQFEGASASNAQIEGSKVRLERLEYFKEVAVETKDVPGTEDLIDVEYTVEEQPSSTIQGSVGYAQYTGLNLGVNVQFNNWLGSGKRLQLGVTDNKYQTLYSFGYSDPYFTPDGVSRGFDAYYRTRDYSKINVTSYSTDAYGANMTFGYPISEVSRIGFGMGYIHQEIRTGIYAPQEIAGSPKLTNNSGFNYISQSDWEDVSSQYQSTGGIPFVGGQYQEFQLENYLVTEEQLLESVPGFIDKYGDAYDSVTLNFNWSRSTLNRGIMATRGNQQTLSLETTVPGSEMEYYKASYHGQMFFPLIGDFTLRLRTRLGYGNGYGDMTELPFFENYYAGGFGSVRGFRRSTLGPRGTPATQYQTVSSNGVSTATGWADVNRDGVVQSSEVSGVNAYIACEDPGTAFIASQYTAICEPGKLIASNVGYASVIGGNILTTFTAEVILPLPFVEDSRSMQAVAFVDAGNVFSDYCGSGQRNCASFDVGELSSSAGVGFTWISAFGPMTFSYSVPLNKGLYDETEKFQFSFGAGF
ncbi:outer membrane protein assembly factor BamA [Teredinibacter waterburyi]|jgi:outer membrane protein assembly complex, YaeT protein|uniref:outer membrane protein assembly factor BamA n=1 Tax=Teredinibacter waterburyi TaxID=1500538 RepID=UPI00165EC797|nr:outer membrane protein assembly factor BamA [Teredinibacter waterburyi]